MGFWFWEKIGVKSTFFRFLGIPECGFGKRNDVIILFWEDNVRFGNNSGKGRKLG